MWNNSCLSFLKLVKFFSSWVICSFVSSSDCASCFFLCSLSSFFWRSYWRKKMYEILKNVCSTYVQDFAWSWYFSQTCNLQAEFVYILSAQSRQTNSACRLQVWLKYQDQAKPWCRDIISQFSYLNHYFKSKRRLLGKALLNHSRRSNQLKAR